MKEEGQENEWKYGAVWGVEWAGETLICDFLFYFHFTVMNSCVFLKCLLYLLNFLFLSSCLCFPAFLLFKDLYHLHTVAFKVFFLRFQLCCNIQALLWEDNFLLLLTYFPSCYYVPKMLSRLVYLV